MDKTHLKIYWENQEGQYCGLHAINSLLQGPYFTSEDLDSLASELDAAEKQISDSTSVSKNSNASMAGNYTIQVIIKALKNKGNYTLVHTSLEKSIASDLTKEQAFICHSPDHWYSIRKIFGEWYDLNSTNKSKTPIRLNDYVLSAVLSSALESGYVIYAVKGNPLPSLSQTSSMLTTNQYYIPIKDIPLYGQESKQVGVKGPFGGKATKIGESNIASVPHTSNEYDSDLEKAISLSLQNAPIDEYSTSIKIKVNGKELLKTFNIYDIITDVKNHIRHQTNCKGKISVFNSYPKFELEDDFTLESYGYAKSGIIIAEIN